MNYNLVIVIGILLFVWINQAGAAEVCDHERAIEKATAEAERKIDIGYPDRNKEFLIRFLTWMTPFSNIEKTGESNEPNRNKTQCRADVMFARVYHSLDFEEEDKSRIMRILEEVRRINRKHLIWYEKDFAPGGLQLIDYTEDNELRDSINSFFEILYFSGHWKSKFNPRLHPNNLPRNRILMSFEYDFEQTKTKFEQSIRLAHQERTARLTRPNKENTVAIKNLDKDLEDGITKGLSKIAVIKDNLEKRKEVYENEISPFKNKIDAITLWFFNGQLVDTKHSMFDRLIDLVGTFDLPGIQKPSRDLFSTFDEYDLAFESYEKQVRDRVKVRQELVKLLTETFKIGSGKVEYTVHTGDGFTDGIAGVTVDKVILK